MESVSITSPRVIVDVGVARAVIAELMLGSTSGTPGSVGRIVLQPHQISAVARLRRAIDEFGGALLCDPVGTGKTFVALALPRRDARVLVVGPAVLKGMWTRAAQMAEMSIEFCSFESLSRGNIPYADFDFLIVDEAHHSRNPATRRYEALARLAARSDVVLLTATPIHNYRADLVSLLSLFLGERASNMSTGELGRCVISRASLARSLQGMPRVDSLIWCRVTENGRIPANLLALPPPVPPRDGGDGGALVTHSLIRQWASSDAALAGGLRRRLVHAEALVAALEDGTWPSRSELQTWIAGEDAVQLSFSSLLADRSNDTATMLSTVISHRDALKAILVECRESRSDHERAELIRHIRAANHGRRIVVFSQYADTVNGMFSLLARDGEVAALTGAGARVAGGIISRSEAIGRFAPSANGRVPTRPADAVTLLLTTDLLSEGVNLQDAGVVIHLDLPWTPARMDQRLGRIARIGSLHENVVSYALAPPIASSDIVRIEAILKRKMKEARMVTGGFASLESWAEGPCSENAPQLTESAREILSRWMGHRCAMHSDGVVAAVVNADIDGFLAACRRSSQSVLVGCVGEHISEDPRVILPLLRSCDSQSQKAHQCDIEDSLAKLKTWLYSRDATSGIHQPPKATSSIRRNALRRVDRAVRTARPHERAAIGTIARQARDILRGILGNHMENEISRLGSECPSDRTFLEHVISIVPRKRVAIEPVDDAMRVTAMIILRRNDTVVSGNGTLT